MAKKKPTKKKRATAVEKLKKRAEAMDLLDQAHLRLEKAKKLLRGSGAPKSCVGAVGTATKAIRRAEKACAL